MVVVLAISIGEARGAVSATRPASIGQLAEAAQSGNMVVAMGAIRELSSRGEAAVPALRKSLGWILARDRQGIESAIRGVADARWIGAAERDLEVIRRSAWENIERLGEAETVRIAHEHYDRLLPLMGELKRAYGRRAFVCDAMLRRPELLKLFGEVRPVGSRVGLEQEEARLREGAEEYLGMSLREISEADPLVEPKEAGRRALWLYRVSRRIEGFNGALAEEVDEREYENLLLVNEYREALGILPLELDLRLSQSARRHSKEMVELRYFAHDSPTETERSFGMRIRNAGYEEAAGENIAAGVGTGREAFRMWFDSPPHHKGMVMRDATALGVGRWNRHWTQNFGRGKRLMLLSPSELRRVEIRGVILPPQGGR